jgi:uncharacterized protein (TIGR00296 family)
MNPHIQLAQKAIETYLKTGQILEVPKDLSEEVLKKKAGVFVSLHKKNVSSTSPGVSELRGCIGTFLPTKENIAQEIIANAISAAFRDPRFSPVFLDELPSLEISVDVLSEPSLCHPGRNEPLERNRNGERPIGSHSRQQIHKYSQYLNPKKYGILVRSPDGRSGLLLPDLPTIDTPKEQITIACQKAGLDPLVDKFEIYRFTVERYR